MAKLLRDLGNDVEDANFTNVINGSGEDISALENDIDAQLSSITAEFDSDDNRIDFKLKVYKIRPNSGKFDWIFDCLPSELPILARLRDEYGGGDFKIRVYKVVKGKEVLNRSLEQSIGMPRPYAVQPQNKEKTNDLQPILSALIDRQNRLEDLIIKMSERPSVQAISPLDTMQTTMAMMSTMMSFLPKPVDNTEMMLKALSLGRELAGESSHESGATDVILEAVRAFAPAIASSVSMPTPMPMQSQQARAQQPQPNPIKREGQDVNKMQEMMFKAQLNNFVKQAAAGKEVDLYAELILDQLSQEQIKQIVEHVDPIGWLCTFNPTVKQHEQWFLTLLEYVRHPPIYDEDEENIIEAGDETVKTE